MVLGRTQEDRLDLDMGGVLVGGYQRDITILPSTLDEGTFGSIIPRPRSDTKALCIVKLWPLQ